MDATFPHAYCVRELAEFPISESRPRYYYPGASREGGRDGVLLEVSPEHGKPWIGVFAFADSAPKGVSGPFTTPHPDRLCVVTRGRGYLVSAGDPAWWEDVEAMPVLDVRPVQARGVLVFADRTRLVAYSEAGVEWRTGELARCEPAIVEVTDEFGRGEFWDALRRAPGYSRVDLKTGAHGDGRDVRGWGRRGS